MNRLIDRYSVVVVAVAATLWATDAYFRNQLVKHLTPSEIVVSATCASSGLAAGSR